MPVLDAFVGGAYLASYPTLAVDQAINVYPETRRAEGSKKTKWLLGTPGRTTFAEVAGMACRGWFVEGSRTFVTIGINVYEVDITTAAMTLLGTIPDNGEPVSYASNGKGGDQIAIVGGGELKIFDTSTNTLSAAIVLPFSDPVMVAFIDAYFLINQRNTPTFWFSALEDGTTWDALDFIARSGTSDNIVGIATAQERVWVWGLETTNQFYNSGDADTPFLPYQGTTTHIGAVSPWAIAQRNNVFTWVAHGVEDGLLVVKATGIPTVTPISTPPIDRWLSSAPTLTGLEMLSYATSGHAFIAITLPASAGPVQTYVWDDIEEQWHARADWDSVNGVFTPWACRGVCQVGGEVFVGHYNSGLLSTLDETVYTNNGAPLVRERTMPYASDESALFIFIDEIELMCQVAVGLVSGQGSAPVVELLVSRDAGSTWISAGTRSLGAIGNYLARVIWVLLGRVRPDRLGIRVRQSDPVAVAWLALRFRSTAGTGQL